MMYKLNDYVLAQICIRDRVYAYKGFITNINTHRCFNLVKRKQPLYTIDGVFKTKDIIRKES